LNAATNPASTICLSTARQPRGLRFCSKTKNKRNTRRTTALGPIATSERRTQRRSENREINNLVPLLRQITVRQQACRILYQAEQLSLTHRLSHKSH
jgi:hypothetical protein